MGMDLLRNLKEPVFMLISPSISVIFLSPKTRVYIIMDVSHHGKSFKHMVLNGACDRDDKQDRDKLIISYNYTFTGSRTFWEGMETNIGHLKRLGHVTFAGTCVKDHSHGCLIHQSSP